jgi:hypothetical protein
MPWYCWGFIFVYEAAQIGHFCWSDINLLQYSCWYTKHKTHNTQHTTTIMSHPIPSTTHPEALSSPSIATANLASDLGAATPYDYELMQGSRCRACTHLCQFPCLGRWYTSSKNREKVKALTLDGCQIDRKIQQPTKTQHQHMRQCRAYRGGVECVWGHCPIIWGTDWWDKNKMNINHPKAWGNHQTARTRNNQLLKLRGSKEGVYWRDGVTRGEHVGDCGSIVFGGRTKGGRQKTKKKIL